MSLAKLVARKLTPEEIRSQVGRLFLDFQHLEGLEKILLFGSAARDAMTEASDLDLVLIFSTRQAALQAQKKVYGMRTPPVWPADLICVDSQYFGERRKLGGVLMVAADEGICVFERKGSCTAAFRYP